jgi:pimeloyl-ACP methyl ester carboxylesterase
LKNGGVLLSCTPLWEAGSFAATETRSWKRLREVSCPITLIYGGESDTFLPKAAKRFIHDRPDDRLVQLEGATHFVPMEKAQNVRDEISRMIFSA